MRFIPAYLPALTAFLLFPALAHAGVLLPQPRPENPAAESQAEAPAEAEASKDPPPEATPDEPAAAGSVLLPVPRPEREVRTAEGDTADVPLPPAEDVDETQALPDYPPQARIAIGKAQAYAVGEEDTLLDIARHFKLGFVELRAANPEADPWTPLPGENIVIPSFKLLPRAPQTGVVVNLAQMRMYYFENPKEEPVTFPIGVGREGLQTPIGETTIVRKSADPVWYPTERMRSEKPWLPLAVPAGGGNPLGSHALYLGWPTFLIHGSNKPWAIGRRVSSGCMRMYPEDISAMFRMVPVGTKVTVVDQPILVGWVGDELYLEANPSKTQSNDIEIDGKHEIKGLSEGLKKVIAEAAGKDSDRIDWDLARKVIEERRGYPVAIANTKAPAPRKLTKQEYRYN